MGARDPQGGSIITSGDGFDWRGGPFGAILGVIGAALVTGFLIAVAMGLSKIIPEWLVMPAVLVSIAFLGIFGLWAVLKFGEWRRRVF